MSGLVAYDEMTLRQQMAAIREEIDTRRDEYYALLMARDDEYKREEERIKAVEDRARTVGHLTREMERERQWNGYEYLRLNTLCDEIDLYIRSLMDRREQLGRQLDDLISSDYQMSSSDQETI
jgi:hypothetical protein